jgi:subtilisin family serine protease
VDDEAGSVALPARYDALLVSDHVALRCDQLMVAAQDLPRVPAGLRRWLADPLPARAGVHRWPLRPGSGADVRQLLADAGAEPVAAAVHLLRAAPRWRSGPARPPVLLQAGPPPPAAADPAAVPVEVAVLDTGITPHPWFTDRAWFANVPASESEVLDAGHSHPLDSVAGHGTFVAGVVQQHGSSARLRIERVLHCDGICDEVDLIEALHGLAADPRPPDVVNLSFGGFTHDDRASVLLDHAVTRLAAVSVVVAAAGNAGSERPFWPAALPTVIAVGALDATGTGPAAFSNHGPWVDTWAIGEDVCGAFVAAAPELPAAPGPEGCFARWSGTSFAAPAVAGKIAADLAAGVRTERTNLTVPATFGVNRQAMVRQ